jgi:AraC-like DNA-binding protein
MPPLDDALSSAVLYVPRVGQDGRRTSTVTAWKPAVPGLTEVFHARMVDFAYPPHCHDVWTVLLVDDGAVAYDLDRRERGATPAAVAVLPPGVVHDGRSVRPQGFRKRVLYLDDRHLPERLVGAAVEQSSIADPELVAQVDAVHRALGDRDDLEAEERLAFVTKRIVEHLDRREPRRRSHERRIAHELRDLLDASWADPMTLESAATTIGRSVTHVSRAFTEAFGVPPHAYVVGRRVGEARRLLLDGRPPADVAAMTGFVDQAHLTRHFKRHVATTPGRFTARSA